MNTNSQTENMNLSQQDCATDEIVMNADSMPASVTAKIGGTESRQSPDSAVQEKPVDFRYVPHGHGPCSCCGQLGE
jgi:hypothetical protein